MMTMVTDTGRIRVQACVARQYSRPRSGVVGVQSKAREGVKRNVTHVRTSSRNTESKLRDRRGPLDTTLHTHRRPPQARSGVAAKAAAYTSTQWLAVALGYSCIIGSVFRCVPQIHRIVTRRSVEGISFFAILTEFLIYSINLAYNVHYKYPFNTYGDLAVSWFVLIFVLLLMQCFRKFDKWRVASVSAMSAIWCFVLFSDSLPEKILSYLQAASSVGLAFGSRIPQIWLNFQQGSTGELSIIMFIANALGCLIRAFTTLSLTQDILLLSNALFHLVLNTIIIVQCVDTRLKGKSAQAGMKGQLSGT